MHTVFALLCFVVVIYWLIFPYPSGLLHWHCGNLTIAPVPAKQPWWIWINTSLEFIMNDCITITKQSTTKPSAYFLGYTVYVPTLGHHWFSSWLSPLSVPKLLFRQLNPKEQISCKLEWNNSENYFSENEFWNAICIMATIYLGPDVLGVPYTPIITHAALFWRYVVTRYTLSLPVSLWYT